MTKQVAAERARLNDVVQWLRAIGYPVLGCNLADVHIATFRIQRRRLHALQLLCCTIVIAEVDHTAEVQQSLVEWRFVLVRKLGSRGRASEDEASHGQRVATVEHHASQQQLHTQ